MEILTRSYSIHVNIPFKHSIDIIDQQKQRKQETYNKWLNTKDDIAKVTYQFEQEKFKRMVNQNKNETWKRKCQEVILRRGKVIRIL